MSIEREPITPADLLVAKSAVRWVKHILSDKANEDDEDVREFVRELVCPVWNGSTGVEEYWQDDPIYGHQMNIVVPIQVGHVYRGLSYAIVRFADNGPIVITILSEKKRQEALEDSWSPNPPTYARTRTRPSAEQSINTPFADLDKVIEKKEVEVKKSEYIISYREDNGEEVMFVGSGRKYEEPSQCISALLGKGIDSSSITVWQKKPVKINFTVDVTGL